MKREQFLDEMKSGLINSVRSFYEPFINEGLSKIEKTTDYMLGINWHYLCDQSTVVEKMDQFFVNGKPIIIVSEAGNIRAISGICPECSNLITLSILYSTCKCLNCENDYNFQKKEGNLTFLEHPIKKKQMAYYVGLKQ